MAVSIGSLKYDIIADATQFKKGVTATRRELSAAKKVMLDTKTPAEKLAVELRGLEKLYEKGAIDIHTYRRAQDALRRQMKEGERQAKRSQRTFLNFAMSLKGLLVAGGVAMTMRSLGREMQVIDEIAKTSRKLGTTTTELQAMRLAGAELAGMMDSGVDMALQRFTRRVSEAAQGTGEAQNVIRELNLDARAMNLAGPVRAFSMVAKAMQGVTSQQDKLRIAFKLFDSEGAAMVNVLNEGEDVAGKYADEVERLGLALDDVQATELEKANDELGRMRKELQGLKRDAVILGGPFTVGVLKRARDLLGLYTSAQEIVKEDALRTSRALNRERERNKVLTDRLAIVAAANEQEADLERLQRLHLDDVFDRNRARIAQESRDNFENVFADAFQDDTNAWQQVIKGAQDTGLQITDILKGAVTQGLAGVEQMKIDAELAGTGPFGDPFANGDSSFFGLGELFSSIGALQFGEGEGTTDVRVANFPDVATRDSRAEFELRKQIAQSQGSMANRQHQEAQQKRTTMADLLAGAVEAIKNLGTGGESFETSGAFKDALADAGNLLEKGFAGSARSSLGDFSGLFQSQENVVEQISKQTTTADQHHAQAQTKREDQKSILQSMLEELQRLSFEAV